MGYGGGRARPVIAYARAPLSSPSASSSVPGQVALRGVAALQSSYRNKLVFCLVVTIFYTAFLYKSGGARSFLMSTTTASALPIIPAPVGRQLQVTTWNIAAINNNPFEYWITYKENPAYEQLMVDVEHFLENPGAQDVAVNKVFTQNMFEQLDARMTAVGWTSVQHYWQDDFSQRTIVSGFMKDKTLGSKRLASMPDRITNTIHTADGKTVFRPTVINMYDSDLSTQDVWWSKWQTFMFDTALSIHNSKSGETAKDLKPWQLLQKIKKSKYPDITEQEEADSLPLQTLCGAIFDAILVHMMNTVSTPKVWQPLKRTMVENLNQKKTPHTLDILIKKYTTSHVICLQEVSAAFLEQAAAGPLGEKYHVIAPDHLDAVRDQNSVLLLDKTRFPQGSGGEISDAVSASFPAGVKVPVAAGDILCITAVDSYGEAFVLCSFHGDTNGLATKPVLSAIVQTMRNDPNLAKHRLVFGLDANTYEHATPKKQQDVLEWGEHYVSYGLTSCWGDVPQPNNYTTYNARTFLQPQLNKACRQSEKRSKGDVNPKDFILFPKSDFDVVRTWKDNTGLQYFEEDTAFPTLQFPSDHGILATIVEPTYAEQK